MSGTDISHFQTTNSLNQEIYWYRIKKAFSIGSIYYPVGAIRLFTDKEAADFHNKMFDSSKLLFNDYLEHIYERY